jgi:hypothetical protein
MVARFGMTEMNLIRKCWKLQKLSPAQKLADWAFTGEAPFWMPNYLAKGLEFYSGFFPNESSMVARFYELMLESMRQVDLLASWVHGEGYFREELHGALACHFNEIEPYRFLDPWSQYLAGRDVLVIHPFADSIRFQYDHHREMIFTDLKVLPAFRLHTFRAVQSIAGNRPPGFRDWFQALESMVRQALSVPADVVIVGCGAYGFPLAARLKSAGRKVIHLGGCTQILFGIRGKRWDSDPVVSSLYNPNWIRPSAHERPPRAEQVESACYW